ncbi:Wd40 repeat, partial [Thalictrum thalictroides]
MPRTIAVDYPGCPPIRALTFDELGIIKVIESRSSNTTATSSTTTPKIVDKWGEPDATR